MSLRSFAKPFFKLAIDLTQLTYVGFVDELLSRSKSTGFHVKRGDFEFLACKDCPIKTLSKNPESFIRAIAILKVRFLLSLSLAQFI
tara:strand:- start:2526 stop:2786 length:261 start_codon:yes stop_codon:yes gene_type:complete